MTMIFVRRPITIVAIGVIATVLGCTNAPRGGAGKAKPPSAHKDQSGTKTGPRTYYQISNGKERKAVCNNG